MAIGAGAVTDVATAQPVGVRGGKKPPQDAGQDLVVMDRRVKLGTIRPATLDVLRRNEPDRVAEWFSGSQQARRELGLALFAEADLRINTLQAVEMLDPSPDDRWTRALQELAGFELPDRDAGPQATLQALQAFLGRGGPNLADVPDVIREVFVPSLVRIVNMTREAALGEGAAVSGFLAPSGMLAFIGSCSESTEVLEWALQGAFAGGRITPYEWQFKTTAVAMALRKPREFRPRVERYFVEKVDDAVRNDRNVDADVARQSMYGGVIALRMLDVDGDEYRALLKRMKFSRHRLASDVASWALKHLESRTMHAATRRDRNADPWSDRASLDAWAKADRSSQCRDVAFAEDIIRHVRDRVPGIDEQAIGRIERYLSASIMGVVPDFALSTIQEADLFDAFITTPLGTHGEDHLFGKLLNSNPCMPLETKLWLLANVDSGRAGIFGRLAGGQGVDSTQAVTAQVEALQAVGDLILFARLQPSESEAFLKAQSERLRSRMGAVRKQLTAEPAKDADGPATRRANPKLLAAVEQINTEIEGLHSGLLAELNGTSPEAMPLTPEQVNAAAWILRDVAAEDMTSVHWRLAFAAIEASETSDSAKRDMEELIERHFTTLDRSQARDSVKLTVAKRHAWFRGIPNRLDLPSSWYPDLFKALVSVRSRGVAGGAMRLDDFPKMVVLNDVTSDRSWWKALETAFVDRDAAVSEECARVLLDGVPRMLDEDFATTMAWRLADVLGGRVLGDRLKSRMLDQVRGAAEREAPSLPDPNDRRAQNDAVPEMPKVVGDRTDLPQEATWTVGRWMRAAVAHGFDGAGAGKASWNEAVAAAIDGRIVSGLVEAGHAVSAVSVIETVMADVPEQERERARDPAMRSAAIAFMRTASSSEAAEQSKRLCGLMGKFLSSDQAAAVATEVRRVIVERLETGRDALGVARLVLRTSERCRAWVPPDFAARFGASLAALGPMQDIPADDRAMLRDLVRDFDLPELQRKLAAGDQLANERAGGKGGNTSSNREALRSSSLDGVAPLAALGFLADAIAERDWHDAARYVAASRSGLPSDRQGEHRELASRVERAQRWIDWIEELRKEQASRGGRPVLEALEGDRDRRWRAWLTLDGPMTARGEYPISLHGGDRVQSTLVVGWEGVDIKFRGTSRLATMTPTAVGRQRFGLPQSFDVYLAGSLALVRQPRGVATMWSMDPNVELFYPSTGDGAIVVQTSSGSDREWRIGEVVGASAGRLRAEVRLDEQGASRTGRSGKNQRYLPWSVVADGRVVASGQLTKDKPSEEINVDLPRGTRTLVFRGGEIQSTANPGKAVWKCPVYWASPIVTVEPGA